MAPPAAETRPSVNHASGDGYTQWRAGFDTDFFFNPLSSFLTPSDGPDGSDGRRLSVQAIFGTQLDKLKAAVQGPDQALQLEMQKVRETYGPPSWTQHAAARGLVDAIVTPDSCVTTCCWL